ncbi:DUF6428 family protein [Mesorhizobium sp. CC13]|uniref:DUF6428 family protein n=1 Tax=Mesorhizobium sp. CC13 TaxID=3029194 RepID=UPI0032647557
MLTPDNREFVTTADFGNDGISIGELLASLGEHKDKPLVFDYDGRSVKPGYHVTEVKAGSFAALDCAANPESWTEIFIQLWDVNEDERDHMSAGKFGAIIRKVTEHLALDPPAKLTFEVSDGIAPMQLHKASAPTILDGKVRVELSARAASCKPRDRWLVKQSEVGVSCCGDGVASSTQPCCG